MRVAATIGYILNTPFSNRNIPVRDTLPGDIAQYPRTKPLSSKVNCNQGKETSTIFKEQEDEKKRKYQQRVLDVEMGCGGGLCIYAKLNLKITVLDDLSLSYYAISNQELNVNIGLKECSIF